VEMAKCDEANAYRQWPICEEGRRHFMFRFLDVTKPLPEAVARGERQPREDEMVYYSKNVLPFGWVRSVEWYHRVSLALKGLHLSPLTPGLEIHLPSEVYDTSRYVDDTLIMALKGWGERAKARYYEVCARYNIEVAWDKDKTDGVVELIKDYLGVQFSSEAEELSIGPERVAEGLRRLAEIKGKSYATRKEFQSLVGVLSFAAQCSEAGPTFLRRCWDALKRKGRFVRLNRSIRLDLQFWERLWADGYNGKHMLLEEQWTQADVLRFWTDASLDGYGAVYETPDGPEFFYGKWSDFGLDMKDGSWHISEAEMAVVSMAAATWGHHLGGRRVVTRCDNDACVQSINRGRCKDPGMMVGLRELFFAMAKHSFSMRSLHIGTKDNVLSDAASRDDWPRFYEFAESEFGWSREMMREVSPGLDVGDFLRRMQKSHRTGLGPVTPSALETAAPKTEAED